MSRPLVLAFAAILAIMLLGFSACATRTDRARAHCAANFHSRANTPASTPSAPQTPITNTTTITETQQFFDGISNAPHDLVKANDSAAV